MKVSLNYLRQKAGVNLSTEELVNKIGAQLGAVEEVLDMGTQYQGVVCVKVVSCEKHPEADKLSLCTVDDGRVVQGISRNPDGLVQVVCGAPNVAAGQIVAWIPPGVTVPSTYDKEPFVLEAREIRGKVSNGMLASAKELAIGDSHEGLLIIDKPAEPGTAFAEIYDLNDQIIDIENKMFTHRPDCLGLLGVAREVAGIVGKKFQSPQWYIDEPSFDSSGLLPLKVDNQLPDLVPRFAVAVVEGIEVKPSPIWLQSQLSRHGVRPINNIVDMTNWLMLETGQPLHAFDYDKVKAVCGGEVTIEVRHPKENEELNLLSGKTITPFAEAIMIAAGDGPAIALGGIMGGADNEVDDNTKNIIIECANFNMYSIRKTCMHHGLFTDASTRFNKGQSVYQNGRVLNLALQKTVELAGGKQGIVVDNQLNFRPQPVELSINLINSRLGLNLATINIQTLLGNVEFEVDNQDGELSVKAPFWRTDIEIAEDVVEEVGRLYGYDHLPNSLPNKDISASAQNEEFLFKTRLREILSGAGLNEVLTYSFTDDRLIKLAGQDSERAYHLRNALSPQLQYYRLSLAPSLLAKVHGNIREGFDINIFEIGKAHNKKALESDVPKEIYRLAAVFASKEKLEGASFYTAKQALNYLLEKLNIKNAQWLSLQDLSDEVWQDAAAGFEPARTAVLKINDQLVGIVGEPKASLKTGLKLPANCSMFELDIEKLFELQQPTTYQSLNRFPSTDQDICLRVDAIMAYQRIDDFLHNFLQTASNHKGYILSVKPIDIFMRDDDKEHKQITWRLTFSHPERTLTNEEINLLMGELSNQASTQLKADRI